MTERKVDVQQHRHRNRRQRRLVWFLSPLRTERTTGDPVGFKIYHAGGGSGTKPEAAAADRMRGLDDSERERERGSRVESGSRRVY